LTCIANLQSAQRIVIERHIYLYKYTITEHLYKTTSVSAAAAIDSISLL